MSSVNRYGVSDISEWYDQDLKSMLPQVNLSSGGVITLQEDVTILNKAIDVAGKLRVYRGLENTILTARYEGMLDGLMWVMGRGAGL